jgi:hypothetical protein
VTGVKPSAPAVGSFAMKATAAMIAAVTPMMASVADRLWRAFAVGPPFAVTVCGSIQDLLRPTPAGRRPSRPSVDR